MCNACSLYQKMKGTPRPVSLKTDVIKHRNRSKGEGGRRDRAAKAAAAAGQNGEGPSNPRRASTSRTRTDAGLDDGMIESKRARVSTDRARAAASPVRSIRSESVDSRRTASFHPYYSLPPQHFLTNGIQYAPAGFAPPPPGTIPWPPHMQEDTLRLAPMHSPSPSSLPGSPRSHSVDAYRGMESDERGRARERLVLPPIHSLDAMSSAQLPPIQQTLQPYYQPSYRPMQAVSDVRSNGSADTPGRPGSSASSSSASAAKSPELRPHDNGSPTVGGRGRSATRKATASRIDEMDEDTIASSTETSRDRVDDKPTNETEVSALRMRVAELELVNSLLQQRVGQLEKPKA